MVRAALGVAAAALVIVAAVFAYHAVAAERARSVAAGPHVTAAFADASRRWLSHIDLPVRRLVLTSAEEYGSGNYLFVFDVYAWFGIGRGFATHGTEGGACSGSGGLMSDGGIAGIGATSSDHDELASIRDGCARAYGPARLVTPSVP